MSLNFDLVPNCLQMLSAAVSRQKSPHASRELNVMCFFPMWDWWFKPKPHLGLPVENFLAGMGTFMCTCCLSCAVQYFRKSQRHCQINIRSTCSNYPICHLKIHAPRLIKLASLVAKIVCAEQSAAWPGVQFLDNSKNYTSSAG